MALNLSKLLDSIEGFRNQKHKLKQVPVKKRKTKSDDINKYENGQVVDKEYSDRMGQRDNAQIPKWMQPDAPIPAHIKDLKCERIKLPNYDKNKRWVVLIRNVLTKHECNDLIQFSENEGYEEALVNIGYGRQSMLSFVYYLSVRCDFKFSRKNA